MFRVSPVSEGGMSKSRSNNAISMLGWEGKKDSFAQDVFILGEDEVPQKKKFNKRASQIFSRNVLATYRKGSLASNGGLGVDLSNGTNGKGKKNRTNGNGHVVSNEDELSKFHNKCRLLSSEGEAFSVNGEVKKKFECLLNSNGSADQIHSLKKYSEIMVEWIHYRNLYEIFKDYFVVELPVRVENWFYYRALKKRLEEEKKPEILENLKGLEKLVNQKYHNGKFDLILKLDALGELVAVEGEGGREKQLSSLNEFRDLLVKLTKQEQSEKFKELKELFRGKIEKKKEIRAELDVRIKETQDLKDKFQNEAQLKTFVELIDQLQKEAGVVKTAQLEKQEQLKKIEGLKPLFEKLAYKELINGENLRRKESQEAKQELLKGLEAIITQILNEANNESHALLVKLNDIMYFLEYQKQREMLEQIEKQINHKVLPIDSFPKSFYHIDLEHGIRIETMIREANDSDISKAIEVATNVQQKRLESLNEERKHELARKNVSRVGLSSSETSFIEISKINLTENFVRLGSEGNSLVDLPEMFFDLFSRIPLKNLDFSMNRIVRIFNGFARFHRSLIDANFSDNRNIKEVPPSLFTCAKVRRMNFSGNAIATLSPDLAKMEGLEEFYLRNNELISFPLIPNNTLSFLRVLDLSHNKLKKLPASFGKLTNLQELDVSHNEISEVDEMGISITTGYSLQKLNLSHNNLRKMFATFGKFKKLQELDASHNKISDVDEMGRYLPEIGEKRDSNTEEFELRKLDLSHNELDELSATFGKFRNLYELNVRHNKIKKVDDQKLIGMRSLRILDVSENRLAKMLKFVWQCLFIQEINLKNACSVKKNGRKFDSFEIDPKNSKSLFRKLLSLTNVNLSGNYLITLPGHIGDLPALDKLNISRNMIRNLPLTLIEVWSGKRLDCSENLLTSIPPKLYANLTYINNEGNPMNPIIGNDGDFNQEEKDENEIEDNGHYSAVSGLS